MQCRRIAGLVVLFVGTGMLARAESLSGIVQSVDADAKKMVVTPMGTDKTVPVTVTDATTIRTDKGVSLPLKYLRKGDGVGVNHVAGTASLITVRQASLRGVVVKTDLDEKTFDMTPKGEDEDVRITTTEKTVFETEDGKARKLEDLKVGDGLAVRFNGPEVAEVVINPKPPELTGYIKSVSTDLQSLVVTEIGTDVDTAVRIDDQTIIKTNDGKPMTIKELKKGDGVGIATVKGVAEQIVVNVKQP
jgi:hypothetical protein